MEAPRQRDVADYETLRSTAMLSGPNHSYAFLPRGLAVWLTAMSPQPLQQLPSETEASNRRSLPVAFASIVLRLTQKAAHA
jgi:hypothetical protein